MFSVDGQSVNPRTIQRSLALAQPGTPGASFLSLNGGLQQTPLLGDRNGSVDEMTFGGYAGRILANGSFISQISQAAPVSEWHRVAADVQRDGSLTVVVLGASPTAGAGAEKSGKHSPTLSWARRLHDGLSTTMAGMFGVPVRTSVFFKGAVGADWYSWCTSRMVAPSTHIVLLEVASAMGSNPIASFEQYSKLLTSARKAAPRALNIIVEWPPWHRGRDAGHSGASQSAASLSAEVLWGGAAADLVTGSYGKHGFYADKVHPNLAGHQLLGAAALVLLTTRLERAWESGSLARARMSLPSTIDVQSSADEVCIASADSLPVELPIQRAWELHDAGKSKGTKKLGMLSTQVNQSLVLRVPELAGTASCAGRIVGLGYLASTAPEQGWFNVDCDGCGCAAVAGRYTSPTPRSFPDVNTRLATGTFGAVNVSITDILAFTLMQMRGTPCRIILTHQAGPTSLRSDRTLSAEVETVSRVRIDSLFVKHPAAFELAVERSERWRPHFGLFTDCCVQASRKPASASARDQCKRYLLARHVV
jgi:hypothetical protein